MQFVRSEEPRQPLLLGVDEAAYFCLTSRLDISFLCLLDSTEWMFFGRPGWLERESFESMVVVHLVREGQAFKDAWADIVDEVTPKIL